MSYGIDRVIISTDDSHFKEFAHIVSVAWRKVFPGVKLTLAYVTSTSAHRRKFERDYDDVMVFNPINGVPDANMAKIARRYVCTRYGNEVCMIEDIDTAPLNRDYHARIVSQRVPGTLGMVGLEVYAGTPHSGKVPSSYTCGESYVWERAINPNGLEFEDWVRSFIGKRVFDHKEDVSAPVYQFSDESLMRAILSESKFTNITHINRDADPRTDWIDRSWWDVDVAKLKRNEYYVVNFMRPLDLRRAHDVLDHIENHMTFEDHPA